MKTKVQTVNIQNKKARFEFEILDKYTAGIVLRGTEIKAIREGKASIAESFCEFNDRGELFVINMTIQEYSHATYFRKLEKEVSTKGLTIVPLKVFTTDKGFAKMIIALAKGKKLYDKREAIKDRDNKKDLARLKKNFNS